MAVIPYLGGKDIYIYDNHSVSFRKLSFRCIYLILVPNLCNVLDVNKRWVVSKMQ